MIRMVSLKSHVYGGKRFQAGDEFTARGKQDAKLLEAVRHAMRVPAPVAAIEGPVYQTKVVVAEPVVEPVAEAVVESAAEPEVILIFDEAPVVAEEAPTFVEEPQPVKQKRTYKRRDLTAE